MKFNFEHDQFEKQWSRGISNWKERTEGVGKDVNIYINYLGKVKVFRNTAANNVSIKKPITFTTFYQPIQSTLGINCNQFSRIRSNDFIVTSIPTHIVNQLGLPFTSLAPTIFAWYCLPSRMQMHFFPVLNNSTPKLFSRYF